MNFVGLDLAWASLNPNKKRNPTGIAVLDTSKESSHTPSRSEEPLPLNLIDTGTRVVSAQTMVHADRI